MYHTTKSKSKKRRSQIKPRLSANKPKENLFFQAGNKKTRSRPASQLQPAKLQLPTKNCFRRTEKAPNRRKRRGSNPASPNKWTSPAPAARPYRASWYHVETKLSLCPAFKNLLQGNFKIVTAQKSYDLNGSTSTPWFKKDDRSIVVYIIGEYNSEPQGPKRPRGTERRTPRGCSLASYYRI